MDAISSSRKRNHSSGVLTRTRSQLFFHRNRSGQLRSDPVSTQDEPYTELVGFRRMNCKKPKRDDDDLPRLLTKDLRARRVYSPPQSTNSGLMESAFSKGSAEATESSGLGLFCEARDFDRGHTEPSEESGKLQDCKGENGGDCAEIIDGLDGATTLPDAEIRGGSTSKINKDERKPESEVPVKATLSSGKDSSGNDYSLKSKSVLRPRFQYKLFKGRGSVNYRRLFPFLMDTMGGDSGTPKLGYGPEFQLPLSSPSKKKSKLTLKTDATADYGVKDVTSDLPNDDLKQLSSHMNNLDPAEASNHRACTSQEFGVLNEECIQTTPPDADIYVNSEVNVKPIDLTRSTQENAEKGKDSLKSKSVRVPRQHLHRKLFKTPGSISYKRFLPFLMDLTKDDSDTSKFNHQAHHQDEADMHAKRLFQFPLSSQSEEASIDEHRDSSPMHGTVESNGLENYVLVNPSNEFSHGNRPKLTPSQDLPELPTQLDANKVVCEDLSAPSVNEHIEKFAVGSKDECFSASELNPCLVMVDDFHSAKNVVSAAHNNGLEEVQNKISRQHNSESPHKVQDMLYTNRDVSELTFVHNSSIEKGLTINCDESKQFANLEECESVSRLFPPEDQSLSQLNTNVLDAEENVRSLNHDRVSNGILRSSSEKIISEKSDMDGHSADKAGSVQNDIVLCSRVPSKGSDSRNVSEIENGSESKITPVLKRCSQFKLLERAGSVNYKRLLPFLLNNMKGSSCASVNDHNPKLAKSMDEIPLLPISTSNLRLTPVSDSNGCDPVEPCAGDSGTQQQTGLHACDLNNDSSSPKYKIPDFQSSHDSCKGIQLQDEQFVLNGQGKPESSTDPSISVHGIDLSITTLAPMINEVTTREEKVTPASPKSSSVFSEVKGSNSLLMSRKCCQSLSQLQAVEQLVPAVGLKNGILKRNPRGCRGLCTCLNCVSFRLNAERAFEFSKNQLLDAEEVALNLMKELSHLRYMLESSADRASNNPVFDGTQVKEACRKAFAAEELAKDRLSQMQDDLNIHCRITSLQPPRVTFAVHVEEKAIQPSV